MIRALVIRCWSCVQVIERRTAAHMSRWSSVSVLIVLLFGCFLMLPGAAVAILTAWYGCLHLSEFNPFVCSPLDPHRLPETATWVYVLGFLFGGNCLRGMAVCAWRQRRAHTSGLIVKEHLLELTGVLGDRHSRTRTQPLDRTTAVLCLCLGPCIVIWGVLLLLEVLKPFGQFFWLVPPSLWWRTLQTAHLEGLAGLLLHWLIAVILLAFGGGLFWIGFRSIMARWQTETVPLSAGVA